MNDRRSNNSNPRNPPSSTTSCCGGIIAHHRTSRRTLLRPTTTAILLLQLQVLLLLFSSSSLLVVVVDGASFVENTYRFHQTPITTSTRRRGGNVGNGNTGGTSPEMLLRIQPSIGFHCPYNMAKDSFPSSRQRWSFSATLLEAESQQEQPPPNKHTNKKSNNDDGIDDDNNNHHEENDALVLEELEHQAAMDVKQQEDETHRINLKLAQFAKESHRNNKLAAQKAYDLLRTQTVPDTVGYNSVLKALAKTSSSSNKRAAIMAESLLDEMEQLYVSQTEQRRSWLDREVNNELSMEEYAKGPSRVRIKPNVRSYSTVMDAWGKQSSYTGAIHAQELLERLQDKFDMSNDYAVMPNAYSYNTVLNAWAKSGSEEEGAEHCEELLHQMIDLGIVDVISYNAAIHAWARSGLVQDAGRNAERLLRTMIDDNYRIEHDNDKHTNGDTDNEGRRTTTSNIIIKPNARTYTTVMDAWSRSHGCDDSAQRAHALLKEMEQLAISDSSMQPNYISYTTVINAYALSKSEPFKAHKAFSLLQHMIRYSVKNKNPQGRPNRVTYNSVLNACATSCPNVWKEYLLQVDEERKENVMEIEEEEKKQLPTLPDMVRTLYQQLLISDDPLIKPDHYTFGTVLKAVANVFWGEPDQVEFCKQVFEEACQRGYVTFGVLVQLRQAAPMDVYRSLIPRDAYNPENGHFFMKHIPKEWTRNVHDGSKQSSSSSSSRYSNSNTKGRTGGFHSPRTIL